MRVQQDYTWGITGGGGGWMEVFLQLRVWEYVGNTSIDLNTERIVPAAGDFLSSARPSTGGCKGAGTPGLVGWQWLKHRWKIHLAWWWLKSLCPAVIVSKTRCWAPTAASPDTEASSTGSSFSWSVSSSLPFSFLDTYLLVFIDLTFSSRFSLICDLLTDHLCVNLSDFQVLTHAHLFLENFIQWV